MGISLERIKPLHPDFNPDPNWEMMGMTPKGHQLFRETTKRARAIPDIDPDTGMQRQMLHPTTAQPLYPLNKPELYDHVRVFYLESEGNGNIVKVDWHAPTDEELATIAREEGIEKMVPELSATLYDSGLTPKDLTQALQMIAEVMKGNIPGEALPAEENIPSTSDPVPADTAADAIDLSPPATGPDFPRHIGGGKWELSDGTIMQGKGIKHAATVAEAKLHDPPSG